MGEDSIVIKATIDTSGVDEGLTNIKGKVTSFSKSSRDSFGKVSHSASGVGRNIGKTIGGGLKSITTATSNVLKGLGGIGASAARNLGNGVSRAATKAAGFFQKIGGTVSDIGKNRFAMLKKGASESMKGVESAFQGALQMAKRLGPMIIGVRSAFSLLQRGASSFLASNKELQSQLNACWTAIGNVIGPVIELLVNLLSTLISYLITFLHLIGLSSMSASDAAKKTKSAAGSMQKSLMGFDEINKLQDSGGGGGGAGSLSDPKLPAVLNNLIAALKQLWETIENAWKGAWSKYGEQMMNALKQLLEDSLTLITDIILRIDEAFKKDGNLQTFFENLFQTVTNIATAVDTIIKAIDDWVQTTDWFNKAMTAITQCSTDVKDISKTLSDEIAPLIAEKVQPWLDTVASGVYTAMTNIHTILKNINELLGSAEGKQAVSDLLDLNIEIQKVHWAFINSVLQVLGRLNLKQLALDVSDIATNATGFLGSLSELLLSEGVIKTATTIGDMFIHVAAQGVASGFNALKDLVDSIKGYTWDDFNTVLENAKIEVSENLITIIDNMFQTIKSITWGGVNLFLNMFKNTDWSEVSGNWASLSGSIRTAAEKLQRLLGNEQVANALSTVLEILTSVVASTLKSVFDSLGTVIDKIGGANWNGINTFLENVKAGVKISLDKVEAVFSGEGTEEGIQIAVAEAIAGVLTFLTITTLTGNPVLGGASAALAATAVLAITGMDAENGGVSVEKVLETLENLFPYVAGGIGLIKGGLGGGIAGLGVGVLAKLFISGALEAATESGELSIDTMIDAVCETLKNSPGIVVAASALIAGGLTFWKTGSLSGSLLMAGIGAGASLSLIDSIETDANGSFSFNMQSFLEKIKKVLIAAGFVIGGAAGAKIGAFFGPVGGVIGFVIGGVATVVLLDVLMGDSRTDSEKLSSEMNDKYGMNAVIEFSAKASPDVQLEDMDAEQLSKLDRQIEKLRDSIIGRANDAFKMSGSTDTQGFEMALNEWLRTGFSEYIKADASERDAIFGAFLDSFFRGSGTNFSYDQYVGESARLAAETFDKNFKDALANVGASEADISTLLEGYKKLFVEGGSEAANGYIQEWYAMFRSLQPEDVEAVANEFLGKMLSSGTVSPEEADAFVEEFKSLYQSAGSEAANAYKDAILNGDFTGTASEFVSEMANAIKGSDTSELESAAEGAADIASTAYGEKLKERSTEESKVELGAALMAATADQPTKENAYNLGASLVDGFVEGISSKQEDLINGVTTVVGAGLGAGDTAYTTWYDESFILNRDQFLTNLTTWLNGTFTQEVVTNSIEEGIIAKVKGDLETALSNVRTMLINAGNDTARLFQNLASNARYWGYDIGKEIARGIFDSMDLVGEAARAVADLIDSYLGFSEPEVGPLSDFHTYMPDMMQLMAQGILQNLDKPQSAVERLASNMSDQLNNWGVLGQLEGISNNVAFQMPAFAEGTVVPYGVSAQSGRDDRESYFDAMYDVIAQAMTAALSTQRDRPIENHVYLDGKQIADSTSKWQRRADRAGGR